MFVFIGVVNWAAHRHNEGVLEVFKARDVIYLSPDSKEVLTTLDTDKVWFTELRVRNTVI